MSDLPAKASVQEGVESVLSIANKPPNDKITRIVHAIIFIVVVVGIFAGVLWIIIQIFTPRPSPTSTTTQNFYNSTVAFNAGITSSSQLIENPISTGTLPNSEIDLLYPNLINGMTPPPIITGGTILPINQKSNDGYHTKIVVVLGVAIGTNAPVLYSITPSSSISMICKFVSLGQPGFATSGSVKNTIAYPFEFDCASNKPIAEGTPLAFELNYGWSSFIPSTSRFPLK